MVRSPLTRPRFARSTPDQVRGRLAPHRGEVIRDCGARIETTYAPVFGFTYHVRDPRAHGHDHARARPAHADVPRLPARTALRPAPACRPIPRPCFPAHDRGGCAACRRRSRPGCGGVPRATPPGADSPRLFPLLPLTPPH